VLQSGAACTEAPGKARRSAERAAEKSYAAASVTALCKKRSWLTAATPSHGHLAHAAV
jgi:hypothetical protein